MRSSCDVAFVCLAEDAITPQGRIIVALVRGRLGNYTESKYIRGFNISKLSPGWHHIAVVGQKTRPGFDVPGLRN